MRHDVTGFPAGWILLAVMTAACSNDSRSRTVESSREVAVSTSDLHLNAKSDERFGLRTKTPPIAEGEAAPSALAWDVPQGWTELPPSSMRAANFRVAGDPRAECYLTLLTGEAGGLGANINRWRTQMSHPIASVDAIAGLPRVPFLGQDAVLVDLAGGFTGMSADAAQPNYRLVGLLLVDPAGSAFLKMVGPDDVIGKEMEAFHALARSFRSRGQAREPAAASDAVDATTVNTAGGVRWTAPDAWQRAPERATRTVSFFVDPGQTVECYVTVLGGDAGGPLANVNRWRDQMGQPPITEEELAALPRTPMLGGQAIVATIDHSEREIGGALDTQMLAAIGELPGRAVFVKVTGPRPLIESQRESFLAFCGSLAPAE